MKKKQIWSIVIALIIYLALFVLGAASGAIHPACFAYAGAVLPLFFSFVYLTVTANMQCFGAPLILNGFVLIIGLIAGEGNIALIIGMILLAAIPELVRKLNGYHTRKGVRRSFIPFAFSFFSYSAHWWTEKGASLAAAVEEMPAGYADKMEAVIGNIPILIIALVLTIPIAIFGIWLAEKVLKKQASALE